MYVIGYGHSRRDTAHAIPQGNDQALCGSQVTEKGGPWPRYDSMWLHGMRRCHHCSRLTYDDSKE